jgi:hypothetical protein
VSRYVADLHWSADGCHVTRWVDVSGEGRDVIAAPYHAPTVWNAVPHEARSGWGVRKRGKVGR